MTKDEEGLSEVGRVGEGEKKLRPETYTGPDIA